MSGPAVEPVAADAGRWAYRPALDGVRALAVAAVLVFHARPDWLPGGFLGVDAFFVLSGFLITGLLLAERARTGRVRLGAFWGRRARRLLPALLLVLLAVAVLGRLLLTPEELPGLRADALAALAYVANWRMIYRGGDYFARTADTSLLQHAWSLGIEEQFYLLWPLLVVLALRARRSRAALLALCAGGAVASVVTAALLHRPGADVSRVYFGTDTRASALLVGAGLAVLLHGRTGGRHRRLPAPGAVTARPAPALPAVALPAPALPAPALPTLAVLALAVLGWAWGSADGADPWLYRGGLAGLALAVAVVVAHLVTAEQGVLARALSLPPVVWVGQLSYGLYLWHWPLYRLLNADRLGLTGSALFGVRLAATLAVAALSFHLVERPIRRGRPPVRVAVPATVGALAGVAALVAAVTTVAPPAPLATWSAAAPAVPQPPAGAPPPPAAAPPAAPGAVAPVQRPGRRAAGPAVRAAIMGDSIAWTLGEYLPRDSAVYVTNRGVPGCGIARLPDIRYIGRPHTNYPGCDTWDARWRAAVEADDPDVVAILLDRWELMDRRLDGEYRHVGDPVFDAYLTRELTLALDVASARGARVALLTAPYTRRAERPDGGLWPEDQPERVDAWNRLLATVAAGHPARPRILDLNRLVCPQGRFTWEVDGVRVRSDGLHFTPAGVQRVIAPWLLPRLAELATTA